jgi:hypothetical protein
VECDFDADEYGGVPHYFSFPTFPIDYFRASMAHNNIVQVDLTGAVFTKDPHDLGLRFHVKADPNTVFEIEPWDEENVTEDLIRSSSDTVVVAFDVVENVDSLVKCHGYYHEN